MRPLPDGSAPAPPRKRRLPEGVAPRLLSAAAAAEYCSGISEATFRDLVAPQVRSFKIGGVRVYDRLSIDRWVDAHPDPQQAPRPAGSWVDRLGHDDRDQGR